MEPAFQRGDILFLDNRGGPEAISVGDIVVFKIAGRDVPIVHRVHRKHDARAARGDDASAAPTPPPGSSAAAAPVAFLTKGDANVADDRDLYAPGQLWLSRGEIVGKAVLYVPYLGMFTILLNDYPVSVRECEVEGLRLLRDEGKWRGGGAGPLLLTDEHCRAEVQLGRVFACAPSFACDTVTGTRGCVVVMPLTPHFRSHRIAPGSACRRSRWGSSG